MANVLLVDGVDVSSLGLELSNLDGWWNRVAMNRDSLSPYGLIGAVPAQIARASARQWPLQGIAALNVNTMTERRTIKDGLDNFFRGLHEWELVDGSGRVAYGVVESDAVAAFVQGDWNVGDFLYSIPVTFYDPAKYDKNPVSVTFGATAVAVPLGNLPSAGIFTISGPSSGAVTIRPRAFGGGLIPILPGSSITQFMTLAALATDEAYVIDMNKGSIDFYDDGVKSNGLAKLTLDDGWFFAFDPLFQPTIEIAGLTGDGAAELTLMKRYLS